MTPILYALSIAQNHWIHRIQAPIIYLLTTTQPPYLHNPLSVQRSRSNLSSSVVTLARPPTSSSLKVTDRFFCYASPCLWNQLPFSLRQPHSGTSSSIPDSHIPSLITSSSSDSLLCSSIIPSLFHSRLKPTCFTNLIRPRSFTSCLHGLLPGPFLLSHSIFFSFPYFSFLCRAL